MKTLWLIGLYRDDPGYAVVISDVERDVRVAGRGESPAHAYADAERHLESKPVFLEQSAVIRDAVRRRIEELNASEIEATA